MRNNPEFIDLEAILNTPTETKSPVEKTETAAPSEPVEVNQDFDEKPIIIEPEKIIEVAHDSSKIATSVVDAVDIVISMAFPKLYEQTLSSEDRTAMKLLARKYREQAGRRDRTLTLSEDDQRIMEIFIDYEDYVNDLDLTEKEKKSLAEPLAELLKDVDYKTSPGNALLIAVCMIMIPRLIPLGKNYFFKDEN